jgi:hypothetical protein
MTEPIEGSVASIEDEYTLIINRGSEHGVEPGMIFAVMADGGDEIIDPENGDVIGERPREKLRIKVSEVHPKFSYAATFRTYTPAKVEYPTFSSSLGLLGPAYDIPGITRAGENALKQLSESGGFNSISLSKLMAREMENPTPVREKIANAEPVKPKEPPVRPEVTVNIGDKVRQVLVVPQPRPAPRG